MKQIIFNDDNLEIGKINQITKKVRAILINEKNEILLASYGDVFLFPGGSTIEEESLEETLKRELKEEIGIEINMNHKKPILLIQQLIKDYPKRYNKGITNKFMKTYYYVISTDEIINITKVKLTKNEIKDNFHTFLMPISDVSNLMLNHTTNNPRNKYFSRELLAVVDEVKQNLHEKAIVKKI